MSRTTAPANPAGLPTDDDLMLADAFQKIERHIADLRGAAAILEIVEDDTIMVHDDYTEWARERAGIPPHFKVYVLTEGQEQALRYATFHIRKRVEELCTDYYDVARKSWMEGMV